MTTSESLTAPSAGSGDAREWQAQIVRDETALTALAVEWDDLYERCSTATAFLSSAWLLSWWRSYGRAGRLVVVLLRRDGRLVAAAAMMRGRRLGLPVLTPLGLGVSDFTDVLIDDSCAAEAAGHLARELIRLGEWQVIDLPEVPHLSATAQLMEAWPYQKWAVPGSVCLDLPVRPIHALIATLPKRTAHTRRLKQRKIEAMGIVTGVVGREAAGEAAAALLSLHQQQWRGRGMNPEHGWSRFAEHLCGALPDMVDRGQAQFVEYRLDGNVVAVDLLLGGHRLLCAYLYGLRPDLRRRIDVTQLLLGTNLEVAQELGLPTLSLLRGDEPYKQRWRPRRTRNRRVLLAGPSSLRPSAYAAAIHVRARLSHVVRTRLPGLRSLRTRLRTCRPSCT
jgi:CelD/BcsL family acetyltransferase involved in cellulose biosynthesis